MEQSGSLIKKDIKVYKTGFFSVSYGLFSENS